MDKKSLDKIGDTCTPIDAIDAITISCHTAETIEYVGMNTDAGVVVGDSESKGGLGSTSKVSGSEKVHALARELENWQGEETGGYIIRRNVLIFTFFYIPMLGFIIGGTYLAEYLARLSNKPPPLKGRKPSKEHMYIYFSVVSAVTIILSYTTLVVIYKRRNTPAFRCKLKAFIYHISVCLLVIPPLTYVTNMLTTRYTPRSDGVKFIQAVELFTVGQIWAAMSSRVALMYIMFIKGKNAPSYTIFLVKGCLLGLVYQLIPFIIAMTVSFPKYTLLIRWGAFAYVVLTLLEILVYVVQLRTAVGLFVDFENVVRMMVMQAVILGVALYLFHEVEDGHAFFRFNQSVVLVWQLIFEMFGGNLWNEFAHLCGLEGLIINQNRLISRAYDLMDPRGRLDCILDDEELYPILLRVSRARYMEENFMFLRDTNDLRERTDSHQLKGLCGDDLTAIHNIQMKTQSVVQKYVLPGANHGVNLPSRLLKPLRDYNDESHNYPAMNILARDAVQDLIASARAYTASLIDQSQIMKTFSEDKEVLDILVSRRHRLVLSCGAKAKLMIPTNN